MPKGKLSCVLRYFRNLTPYSLFNFRENTRLFKIFFFFFKTINMSSCVFLNKTTRVNSISLVITDVYNLWSQFYCDFLSTQRKIKMKTVKISRGLIIVQIYLLLIY